MRRKEGEPKLNARNEALSSGALSWKSADFAAIGLLVLEPQSNGELTGVVLVGELSEVAKSYEVYEVSD
jgi:hypothetical protein